jgi:hypothetical protein
LPDDYHYASDNNTEWLSLEGIKELVAPFEAEPQKGS